MSLVAYPAEDYNSWISEGDADTYFENRLNSDEWNSAVKEVALITAFRDLNYLLNLQVDLSTDETPLEVLKTAQCEQTLYLLRQDVDFRSVESMSLSPSFFVKLGKREPRICYNAIKILSDYLVMKTIARIR